MICHANQWLDYFDIGSNLQNLCDLVYLIIFGNFISYDYTMLNQKCWTI